MENLPKGVLIEIVSHLPMKEAVRSSAVSRRWKDLWKETTGRLDLDLDSWVSVVAGDEDRARRIGDRYLELHHPLPIRSFRVVFYIRSYEGTCSLKQWLAKVHSMSDDGELLEELELDLRDNSPFFRTSFDLFSIPGCEFRSLRSITLRSCAVGGDDLIDPVLQGCVWLEKLCLEHCIISSFDGKLSVRGGRDDLRLKHLTIFRCRTHREVVDIDAANLSSFDFTGRQKLRINAPNLRWFRYYGRRQRFKLLNLPTLSFAAIRFCTTRYRHPQNEAESGNCEVEGEAKWGIEMLLVHLAHVKSLEVDCGVLQTVVELEEKQMGVGSSFRNLEKLVVSVKHPFEKWAAGLCGLLEMCPGLRHLGIDTPPQSVGFRPWSRGEEYFEQSCRFPSCLIHDLKSFRMAQFEEKKGEMLFIERLLKKGQALESVEIITTDDRKGPRWHDPIRSRLEAMPANSTSIDFVISNQHGCNQWELEEDGYDLLMIM